MARTKASRGAPPFSLKSGNSPMNIFGLGKTKFGKFMNKAAGMTPIGMAVDALKGNNSSEAAEAAAIGAGGGTGSDEKLKAITQILSSDEGGPGTGGIAGIIGGSGGVDDLAEGTALTKKSPMQNYKNPRDYKVFNMGNEASPSFKKRKNKKY